MWRDLAPVGRSAASGGYFRQPWASAETELRAWFAEAVRGARASRSRPTASATRSPGGGPSRRPARACSPARTSTRSSTAVRTTARWAWCRRWRRSTCCATRGFAPARPIGVSVFAEEEGSRFGLACLGSRLVTGAIDVGAGARAAGPRRRVPRRRARRRRARPGGRAWLLARPGRLLRRAARRAGPRPRRPRRRRRGGQRDLAARALPLRLRRARPTTPAPRGWRTGTTRCSPTR